MNEEINGAADRSASKPKPLRKLTRIDSSRNIHENDDNPAHEAHPYQPQHEAPASHEYHGRYEAVEPGSRIPRKIRGRAVSGVSRRT